MFCCRGEASRGARGASALPDFGSSDNPIPTRGADYAHHIAACPSQIWKHLYVGSIFLLVLHRKIIIMQIAKKRKWYTWIFYLDEWWILVEPKTEFLFFLASCTNLQMLPSARKDVKNFTSGFEMCGGDVTMMVVFVWHSIWTIVLLFLSC